MNPETLRPALLSLADQPGQLVDIIIDQAGQIQRLQGELDQARREADDLREQLDEARRQAARQAAPFRRPDHHRSADPQKPGRPKGHPASWRRPPEPDIVLDAPFPDAVACSHCGADCSGQPRLPVVQFIEELPPVRPVVTRLTSYEVSCPACGKATQSPHPLKVSTASGAAGTHLGPRALAVAAQLQKGLGLTMRKTCLALDELFGLSLTPGGLSQALDRVAVKMTPGYDTIAAEIKADLVAYVDETSWYLAGPKAWLHVFATLQATLYVITDNRSRRVVHEILGSDFPGVLVTDCLNIYDNATSLQHKCYAHHHKAIAQARELHPAGGEGFLSDCRALLRAASALKAANPDLPPDEFSKLRLGLQDQADLLLDAPRENPLEESVRNRLAKQADHLFTFLDHDGVDATNNLAERQLRPAVIVRKVSCGNKSPTGAYTTQVLYSLAATARQRGQSFLDNVARAMPISR